MIESIEVGNESCFKENMQLSELSKINYIFGPNGSGKTTISELLAANNMEEKSSIHWLHDGVKTIKVYNYHSARTTFTRANGEETGVFLLGDDSKEKHDEIKKLEKDQEKSSQKIKELNKNLEGSLFSCWGKKLILPTSRKSERTCHLACISLLTETNHAK